jgi:hypothetical protein
VNSKLFYANEASSSDVLSEHKAGLSVRISDRHTFKFNLSKNKQVIGSDFGLNVIADNDSLFGYLATHTAIKLSSLPEQNTRALKLYYLANFGHWLLFWVLSKEQVHFD